MEILGDSVLECLPWNRHWLQSQVANRFPISGVSVGWNTSRKDSLVQPVWTEWKTAESWTMKCTHGHSSFMVTSLMTAKLASQRIFYYLCFSLGQFINPALSNFDFATLTYPLILPASLDKGSRERKWSFSLNSAHVDMQMFSSASIKTFKRFTPALNRSPRKHDKTSKGLFRIICSVINMRKQITLSSHNCFWESFI